METLSPVPDETGSSTPTRPTAITVICVIGFLGALFTIPLVFSDIPRKIGAWYPPYLVFSALVGFFCMLGLWKMRRWAVLTYTGFVAINQVVLFVTGFWTVSALLIPGIVIIIGATYFSKMR